MIETTDARELLPDGGLAALDRLRRPEDADPGTGTRYRVVTLDPNELRLQRMLTTERFIYGVKTPFVGRRETLEQLYNAVRDATTQHRLHVVDVVGSPGVGKTRLLAEMFAILDPRARGIGVIPVACSPSEGKTGLSVVAQLVRRRFRISPGDRESVARDKILEVIEPMVGPREMSGAARMLGYLAGLRATGPTLDSAPSDMAQFRRGAVRALLTVFRHDAALAPQVFVIHRSEHLTERTRGVLVALIEALAELPVVVMCVGSAPPAGTLRDEAPVGLRLDITPLSDRDVARQVRSIIDPDERDDPAMDALVETIVSRACGSPRIAEDNIRLLIQLGALDPGSEPWRLDPSKIPAVDALPSTVGEASLARVGALGPARRRLLEVASVFGYNFWVEGLVHVMRGCGHHVMDVGTPWLNDALEADVAQLLAALTVEGLVAPQEASGIDGQRELAFTHHADRNHLYGDLAGSDRGQMHRLAAQWLTSLNLAEPGPWHEVVGNHWDEGGRPADAADSLILAADAARDGLALDRARALYRRAIGLLGLDRATLLVGCLARFGDLASETGDFAEARAIYGAMLDASQLLSDVSLGAVAWLRLGATHRALGDYTPARACLANAETLYRRVNDSIGTASAMDQLAKVVWLEGGPGGYSEALTYFERALALRRRLDDAAGVAESLGHIANIEIQRNELEAAKGRIEEVLEIRRRTADWAGQATCFVGLGAIRYMEGDL
ncbi:MAG: tetratricopeptide (TPR) repeat protein, partial [Myxococcota bacterium]